jgi:hypothetical protein
MRTHAAPALPPERSVTGAGALPACLPQLLSDQAWQEAASARAIRYYVRFGIISNSSPATANGRRWPRDLSRSRLNKERGRPVLPYKRVALPRLGGVGRVI